MVAIIFGASGQDGYYLTNLLERQNVRVIGVSRSGNFLKGNIADDAFVTMLVKKHQPEYLFHFAANSTTRHDALFENHQSISTGTLNILEAVYLYSKHTKVFLSGSGLQFKNEGLPISENDGFQASSPYSVSRIQSVYAGRYYRSLGVKVYIGYFFNHDSPLRSERHINQKIVLAVKRIANGSIEKIDIGDVNVRKEFTYAKDVVEAIWIFVNNNEVFEAVIGSGKAYSIADWLEICFNYFNKNWKDFVVSNVAYKTDYDILVSDPKTIISLGWKQTTSIQDLAKIMIEYEREKAS